MIFFITFGLFLIVGAAMAVGYIFQNKTLAGSCGGLASVGIEKACNCESYPYESDCQLSGFNSEFDFDGCKANSDEACESAVSRSVQAIKNAVEANDPNCIIPDNVYAWSQELDTNCNKKPIRFNLKSSSLTKRLLG